MTNHSLARSHLVQASRRLKTLPVLLDEEACSDVVRKAQELVELALKGVLRQIGVEPPHWHDVGSLLREHRDRLQSITPDIERLARISANLRLHRELSFYGATDWIPTERYTRDQARKALDDATWVVSAAARIIERRSREEGEPGR